MATTTATGLVVTRPRLGSFSEKMGQAGVRALGQRGERGLVVFDLEPVLAAFFHDDADSLADGVEGFAGDDLLVETGHGGEQFDGAGLLKGEFCVAGSGSEIGFIGR